MRNVPLVLIRDPLRAATAWLILIGISFGTAVFAGTQLAGPSPDPLLTALNVLVVAVILTALLRYLPMVIYRAIFPSSMRAIRAMGQSHWAEAMGHYRQLLAEVGRRPGLERLRTPLFLDTLKYSWRASALINIAFCHTRLGDIPAAAAAYEECLEIEPDNVVAISALNLINLFCGKAVRPARDLIERYLFDPGEQQRLSWMTIGLEVVGVCLCLNFSSLLLISFADLDSQSFVWYTVGLVIMLAGGLRLYRWAARRLFLADLYQGVDYLKKGQFEQALVAFQAQYYVLESNSWVDRYRWLVLLSPTTYSFREVALLYQVAPYVQLGDKKRVMDATRECLRINPLNVFAHTRLELVEAAQSVAALEQDRT